ncbi:MAG: hypothetical protein Q8P80_03415 [Candidatus Levybacteria bacterium]|nr:hypothetical protein [Candidatus Levybacteria bacterium]
MNKKNILILLFLVLFSVPSIFSLLHPGFFQSDDGEWMVIRFSAFHQALRDGQFPVRFLGRLNSGYGYPVANFLYPGFMYLAEPVKFLGIGFADAIKIVLGISMIGSAVFTYLWLSKIFNKTSAFIGSLFYLYTPYHLFDLYKRGSVGEVLALAIVPFILWQIERRSFFWITLGIAFLILSHNTLAVLFLPIIVVYLSLKRISLIHNSLFIILLSLGLSAFFWVPAVFELPYVRFSQVSVSDFSLYFAPIELIGISTIIVLVFISFYIYEVLAPKVQPWSRLNLKFILMTLLSLLSIFFSSKISLFFWNYIPSSFIQFPFRLLSYLPLSLAFLSAFIIFQQKGKKLIIVSLVLLAVLSFSVFPYLKPAEFFDKGEGFYSTNEGTTTVADEYLPKWVKQKPTEHFKEKVQIAQGVSEINNLVYNSKNISFNIDSQTDSKVRINTIYYPGWEAFVDGNKSSIQYQNDQGVMELFVPQGEHLVKLSFSETPLRISADIISILSMMVLVIFFVRRPRLFVK